jgi:hypothetical protein
MGDLVNQFKGLSWHAWAASILALLYVLPHLWWMFGVSLGFPGDSAVFDGAFDRTWFVVYNVIATVLVIFGAAAVVSLSTRFSKPGIATLVRVGAILLLLRGGLGLLSVLLGLTARWLAWVPQPFDTELGTASLFWEIWFVVTGIVFFHSTTSRRPDSG